MLWDRGDGYLREKSAQISSRAALRFCKISCELTRSPSHKPPSVASSLLPVLLLLLIPFVSSESHSYLISSRSTKHRFERCSLLFYPRPLKLEGSNSHTFLLSLSSSIKWLRDQTEKDIPRHFVCSLTNLNSLTSGFSTQHSSLITHAHTVKIGWGYIGLIL